MKLQEQMINKNSILKEWGFLNESPTFFARKLIADGVDITLIKENLIKNYAVSEQNAGLVYNVVRSQKTIIRNDKLVNILIRFPSIKNEKTDLFKQALKTEISKMKEIVFKNSYVVRSLYIAGNIFNVFAKQELDDFLAEFAYPVSEYSVEIENFETLSEEDLITLKNNGVTRLVFDTKTFVVKTLKSLKKHHTNQDVFSCYMMALKHNFVVDMAFGAGLENETGANFKKTLSTALELSPYNIKIVKESCNEEGQKMFKYGIDALLKAGYKPYYFSLDVDTKFFNEIGFALEGKTSLFNVDFCEETLSVLACGVGATSKKVFSDNVATYQNPSEIEEYLNKIDLIVENKKIIF